MEAGNLSDADLLDPTPDIHALFCYYNQLYFGNNLGACTVDWSSKRMTLCAGVCHYMKMGGCAIRLSEPLLKFRSSTDFKNTLLHEMIHAYLWLTNGNKDHNDHGPCFQKVMKEINNSTVPDHQRPFSGYHITIYHNFSDEVNNYRTHHWKCQICGDLIKRAMNREPSAADCMRRAIRDELCIDPRCHWHRHRRSCLGEYKKIAEPPGYQDKRKRTKSSGKLDNEGKKKDDTTMRKINKSTTHKDVIKEGNAISTQSHRTLLLETFYPKLDKEKVNSGSDEYIVPDEKGSEDDFEEVLTFKRRKCKTEENLKGCSSSMPATEVEQSVVKRSRKGQQQSEEAGSSGNCKYNFNVMIEWKGWYAFEREDDERGVEALINKRQERRRKEKMLKLTKRQIGGNAWNSLLATQCEDSDKNDGDSILEAGRSNDLSVSDLVVYKCTPGYETSPQLSLIEEAIPRLDSSSKTCTVDTSSSLTSASRNLLCGVFSPSDCNRSSLQPHDDNMIEASLKSRENSFKKFGFEVTTRNSQSPVDQLDETASGDTVTVGITRICVKEEGKTSAMGDEKETVSKEVLQHSRMQVLNVDMQVRGSKDFIPLDDTDEDDTFPTPESIKREKGLFKKNHCSEFSGTVVKGDSVEPEKMNASFEISDSGSEEDCLEKLDVNGITSKGNVSADEVGRKRIGTQPYVNTKAKREQKESRQRRVSSSLDQGLVAECPVCGRLLEGDIGQGDFNQQFNVHLDQCFGAHA